MVGEPVDASRVTAHACGNQCTCGDENALRVVHINKDERKDSIEIGSMSKGGASLKVYFNANNPEEACDLIDHALVVRAYAKNALAIALEKEAKDARVRDNEAEIRRVAKEARHG